MKSYWFTYMLVLMVVSVLAIGYLQWHWVRDAADDQLKTFNQSVERAAASVVRDLEEQSTAAMITHRFNEEAFWNWRPGGGDDRLSFRKVITRSGGNPDSISLELKEFTREVLLIADNDEEDLIIRDSADSINNHVVITRTDRKGNVIDTVIENQPEELVEREAAVFFSALRDVLVEKIEQRPNPAELMRNINLDSLIQLHLEANGIDGEYEYGVSLPDSDSLWSEYSNTASMFPNAFDFSFPIYPNLKGGPLLLLSFPEKTGHVLKGMAEVLVLVGLFSLLIISTFALTIFYILRQKKLSAIKSDFINNMTHEFKTPLATIGLAVDSMRHPNVRERPVEVDRLSEIIEQENKRMYGHVERILQLAKMESGELIIEKERIDLNELLSEAAHNMNLQAASKKCHIELELDGTIGTIVADRSHLYNVVVNLLDNALKYCEKTPEVRLVSKKVSKGVSVYVVDNGVGMTPEMQKRVTETFYRVQGGNLHDVKGFGLGLSYVREIVRLHGGELFIRSKPAKGSTIGFTIPLS